MTDWARVAATVHVNNPRFKTDNMIPLELDLPQRTTEDFEPTYLDEEQIAGAYYANNYADEVQQPKSRSQSSKRPKTASNSKKAQAQQRYA
jgi:hypothetical protein